MYYSHAEPNGNFVFVFLKLDYGDEDTDDHDDDNEDANNDPHEPGDDDNADDVEDGDDDVRDENEDPPGERVNAHLTIFLHTDFLQWIKIVRYLPDYDDS